MPAIRGLSIRGAHRILEVDRRHGGWVRLNVHHPVSGEGWVTEVLAEELHQLPERLANGEHISIDGSDGRTMVEFGASQFARTQDRPAYSSVWVRPTALDSTRRSGEGWLVNVPTEELARTLRQEVEGCVRAQ